MSSKPSKSDVILGCIALRLSFIKAITVLARSIQLMDDLPYSKYHDEYMMKRAVLEYLKFIAIGDMKVKGKLN